MIIEVVDSNVKLNLTIGDFENILRADQFATVISTLTALASINRNANGGNEPFNVTIDDLALNINTEEKVYTTEEKMDRINKMYDLIVPSKNKIGGGV